MSDFEDESTSENEIERDSSDSSEYAPEQQYQAAPKQVAKKCVIPKKATPLADETATTSGEEHVASPPKVSEVKNFHKGSKSCTKSGC